MNEYGLLIEENLKFILSNIDWINGEIAVHIHFDKKTDYPRYVFILFTLARLYKSGLAKNIFLENSIDESVLLDLFWNIYKKSQKNLSLESMRYVDMYGMRFLKVMNKDFSVLLDNFKKDDYASIYSYPVSMYVFMSTYEECELKKDYDFSEYIYFECLKTFENLLFSDKTENTLLFGFAELNRFKNIPYFIKEKADFVIKKNLKAFLDSKPSSSGSAKLLEYFGRDILIEENKNYFNEILDFLNKRKYSTWPNYANPSIQEFDQVYLELSDSQYICLDTNAHIINSIINIYESTK